MKKHQTKSLAIAFTCLLSLLPVKANALEITYIKREPFSGSLASGEGLLLRGEIVPGDYDYLIDTIKSDPERFLDSTGLILSSPGGDVSEALKIATFVKRTYTPVWVGEWAGPCVSACFFIYATAPRREAGTGTIGVHRPYVHPKRLIAMSIVESEKSQKQAMQAARAYLVEHDVPTSIIDKMFQSASTEVHWLSREELDSELGRRPPWFEQYLIAHCGYDKALENRYFETNNDELGEWLSRVEKCGNDLSRKESRQFMSTLKRKSRK